MSRYLGPIDEGQDLITREWLEKNQDKLSIETHQYTGVYTSNTSYCYHYFLRLIPDDINCMWRVKYRMFIDAIGNSTYRGEYIVEWYGYGVTLTGQKIWNSRYNYPIYYHARAYPKDGAGNTAAANCLSYGHFFGVYINSDYNGNKAAYARNIKVELIDYNNCSIEFLDKCYNYYLDSMTLDVSGTQKTFKVNDICTVTTSNATTNGLQESSDSDTTTQNYLYNALFTLSERFSRYAIVGVDGDNKLHPISVYTNGSTKYSTSMASKTSGYRTYTQKGFDLSKGFFYCSSTGNYDADTNQVLTIYFNIPGIDFRYSDNCLASTTATNMGLECLKAVYLRGTIGTDGLFYVAPMDITYNGTVYQRAWTQDIPTEEDGYVYVLLGYPYYSSTYAHSEYRLTLVFEKKAYWYHDGAFRRYYSFKEISNTPTTLAGYGITDAKIASGVITLGSNTITPLTASSTLDATKLSGIVPQSCLSATNIVNALGNTAVNVASKLGTATVGSSTMPIYLNAGVPTAISSFPEAYLSWGGRGISSSISPIDAACCDEFGHNKFAFLPASCFTVEYSNDAGATWIDYGLTDAEKIAMLTTSSVLVTVGKGQISSLDGTYTNENVGNYLVRFTISTRQFGNKNGDLYTQAMKLLVNFSTNGATGCKATLERQTVGNYNAVVDEYNSSGTIIDGVWVTIGTYDIGGWSGWNSIPLGFYYGGGSNQTDNVAARIRLTFKASGVSTTYSSKFGILDFRLIGITNWTMPSGMARYGHLYSFDTAQNATFPAQVTATKFKVSGGTSSQFLKADGGVDTNTYLTASGTIDNVKVGNSSADTDREIVVHKGNALYATSGVTMNYSKKSITASMFVVTGGTSTGFLKADGSVDSTDYLSKNLAAQTYIASANLADWAKSATKPSYNLDEVTDGATRKLSNYLPLSGGQMTGPLTWKDSNALPQDTAADYILTISAFTSGGTTKWISKDNFKTAIGLSDYLPLAGGSLSGNLYIPSSKLILGIDSSNTDKSTSADINIFRSGTLSSTVGVKVETDSAAIIFGIGSGGTNRGIYDGTLGKWLLHYDGTNEKLFNTLALSTSVFRSVSDKSVTLGNSSYGWKGIYVSSDTSASNAYGVNFKGSSARISASSSSKALGIYAAGDIYIRPSTGSAISYDYGIRLTTTDISPENTATDLGNTTKGWNKLYVNEIYIGNTKIYWDSENQCLRFTKSIVSDEAVTAGGVGSGGGAMSADVAFTVDESVLGTDGSAAIG